MKWKWKDNIEIRLKIKKEFHKIYSYNTEGKKNK